MSYRRIDTQDGVTIMNKDLYDNLQDGIEERGVTPEMFGAVGDGVHDDTEAIQKAINFITNNHLTLCLNKIYRIDQTLVIKGSRFTIFGLNSNIEYSGNDSAIRVTGASDCSIFLGYVSALKGNCIEFYSTSSLDYVQYVNLEFKNLKSKNNCILFNPVGGWTTEVRIFGGMLNAGNYGIFADSKNKDMINGIKVYNLGIEGVTTGFYLANGCQSWSIISPRYAEAHERVFETVGTIRNITFIGSDYFYYEKCLFSEKTHIIIRAPLTMEGGVVISSNGIVNNGIVLPNTFDIGYFNLSNKGEYVDLSEMPSIQRRCPRFIYASGSLKHLKLSKEMGSLYGLNEFYIRYYSETNSSLKVEDSKGNIIYNSSNITSLKLKFLWLNEIGWKYESSNLNL